MLVVLLFGCGRERRAAPRTLPLPVQVLADTTSAIPLAVRPPDAHIWVSRVTTVSSGAHERSGPEGTPPIAAPGSGASPALPEAGPDSIVATPAPPTLEIDPRLEPPIPRRSARLTIPAAWRPKAGEPRSVELDLRIEETGEVAEIQWAGGSRDSALVRAAMSSARSMSFFPALQGGHPVAVWCRQRFDFGATSW